MKREVELASRSKSMKNNKITPVLPVLPLLLVVCALLFGVSQTFSESAIAITATDSPVLITSCGQSPGSTMIKVIFMKLKLPSESYAEKGLAKVEDLQTAAKAGTPYRSLIIVMGASLKGMGAAGVSIKDELARTAKLIDEARSQGMTIIGAHIEGMKRRAQGAAPGDNSDELSIDAVAPNCDLLIVKNDGNTDGRFTTISESRGIPMIEVEKTLDLLPEFENLFKK